MRTRTFPVTETDGEVSLRFQARACLQDQKGLVKERGGRDASAFAKKGGCNMIILISLKGVLNNLDTYLKTFKFDIS